LDGYRPKYSKIARTQRERARCFWLCGVGGRRKTLRTETIGKEVERDPRLGQQEYASRERPGLLFETETREKGKKNAKERDNHREIKPSVWKGSGGKLERWTRTSGLTRPLRSNISLADEGRFPFCDACLSYRSISGEREGLLVRGGRLKK